MENEAIQKVLENRIAMIFVMLGASAGAIVAIAAGFRFIYKIITLIGA